MPCFAFFVESAKADTTSGIVGYWLFNEDTGSTLNDYSGYNNVGSIFEATWTSTLKGSALLFDGINDYVSIANSSSLFVSSPLTITAWVYPTNITGYRPVITKNVVDSTNPNVHWEMGIQDGTFRVNLGNGTHSQTLTSGGVVFSINAWYHMALVVNSSHVSRYLNGVLISTNAKTVTSSANGNMYVGSYIDSFSFFKGAIHELSIYNRALSASDVSLLYAYQTNSPTVTINNPHSQTYAYGNISVSIASTNAATTWFNVKNGTSGSTWVYGSNTTYTDETVLSGFVNGTYTFYAWAISSGGITAVDSVTFTVETPTSLPSVNMDSLWLFWYEGNSLGFFQAFFIANFLNLETAIGLIVMLFMVPIYIRTKSLLLCCILWLLIGSLIIAAMPIASGIAVIFMALAIGGLIYRLFIGNR